VFVRSCVSFSAEAVENKNFSEKFSLADKHFTCFVINKVVESSSFENYLQQFSNFVFTILANLKKCTHIIKNNIFNSYNFSQARFLVPLFEIFSL